MLLAVIVHYDKGVDDQSVRRDLNALYGWPLNLNLGPLISNVTKQSKRVGVDVDAILERRAKRLPNGKVSYYFRIPEAAARVIKSIPDFDKEVQFTFDDDLGSI